MAGDRGKRATFGSGLSAQRAWEAALPRIRSQVGDTNYLAWIVPLQASGDRETVALTAPTATISASVSRHFVPLISKMLKEVSGREWSVHVSMHATAPVEPAAPSVHGHAAPDATFERFVVGDSNREAFRQAKAVADGTFAGSSPLVLFGGVGLGKTHLAGAIANAVHARRARHRVVCEPATEFVDRLLAAMRGDRAAADNELTDVAMLILDDIHFLAGQLSTQDTLVWTFAVLHEHGTPVVLTSDRAPQEIPDVDERLRRRFEGGVLVHVDSPERDLRRRILLQKAADRGLQLPPDVAAFVASRVIGSGRTLEGALTRLFAYAGAGSGGKPSPVTRALASRALRAFETPRQPVTPEVVRAVVCEARGLPIRALATRSRTRDVTVARQLAMYLCRRHTRLPLREIAVRFGRRDHSTVLHACEVIEAKRAADPVFDAAVRRMEELLQTRAR
jgi:chromosomal replication initiator protein